MRHPELPANRSQRVLPALRAAVLCAALATGLLAGCESDGRPVSSKTSSSKSSVTKSRATWESSPGAVRGHDRETEGVGSAERPERE